MSASCCGGLDAGAFPWSGFDVLPSEVWLEGAGSTFTTVESPWLPLGGELALPRSLLGGEGARTW